MQTLRTKTSHLKQGKRLFNKQDKNFDYMFLSCQVRVSERIHTL